MKKNYTTPTIEKIAFRYRDQVVVASGGTDQTSDVVGSEMYGITCDGRADKFMRGAFDFRVCDWTQIL